MSADHVITYRALEITKCPHCGRAISRVPPGTITEVRLAPQIELARPGSDLRNCKRCNVLVEVLPRREAA